MFELYFGMRSCSKGFSLIELMVTISVLAILLAIAVPSFTQQIQSGRAQMAADGLKRVAANARAIASQTGKRTTLTINGSVTGCENSAWAITQGSTVLGCLTSADFAKRYESTALSGASGVVLSFLPTGIANNTAAVTVTMTSGSAIKQIRINAGGTVDAL